MEKENQTPNNSQPAGQDDKNKIKHYAINLPKGGGAISGLGEKFQANAVTGTGSFSVPLPITPGRSGFAPQLNLSYNSGSGNSAFGLGWDVGVPAITRKTDKELPTYEDAAGTDTFILSGAEDLVPVLEHNGSAWQKPAPAYRSTPLQVGTFEVTTYRPRIEGLFARIEKWQNTESKAVHWQATTKENITSVYGLTEQARIFASDRPLKVFSWLLEKTFDAKGNTIEYEYKQENSQSIPADVSEFWRLKLGFAFNQRYLKRVRYAPFAADATRQHFQLVLDYGEHTTDTPDEATAWPVRQDPFSHYKAGFEVRTYRLCQRVLMFHNFPASGNADDWQLVKALELTHEAKPTMTFLKSLVQKGYKRRTGGYETKSLPPLEFAYTQPVIDTTVRTPDADSKANLPMGLDNASYQWVDLKGEGLSGVLSYQDGQLFYKDNLGNATFGEMRSVAMLPQPVTAGGHPLQVTDLDSDGTQELVVRGATLNGYFEYKDDVWENFIPFRENATFNLNDPNTKMIDLTGDGRPDILITENEVFTWYTSVGKTGYESPVRIPKPKQEEQGPAVVFADSTQSIQLADMSGDGLTDIVRIRNGEVCYWPNLGFGRFGRKVEMKNAPRFTQDQAQFNPRNIQLNDLDGSGTTDIFYFGNHKVEYWLNEAGNGFGAKQELDFPMPIDSLTTISLIDFTSKGTLSLVWSTKRPGQERYQLSYMDLMTTKPHLMSEIKNNLGKLTKITYVSSTQYYLADKKQGKHWITKLPFPVQALAQVETLDLISGSRLVNQYTYHHGYYDTAEREFRGFGMVETVDTETFETYSGDPKHYVKPVLTKTWFHNGACIDQDKISKQYVTEYYHQDPQAFLLPDTIIENSSDLDAVSLREAYRALKGSALRSEVYEQGVPVPYQVTEANFNIKTLQPMAVGNKHAVFFPHPHETLTFHYEQNQADPRISHEFNLEVDAFGNTLKSASVVYPRRTGPAATPEQQQAHATLSTHAFINITSLDSPPLMGGGGEGVPYLVSVPAQTQAYEINGLVISDASPVEFYALKQHLETALTNVIPFEQAFTPATLQARLFQSTRNFFWNTAQTQPLALGTVTDKALLHHTEVAVFTPAQVEQTYASAVTPAMLAEAGYVLHDGYYWNPGLTQHYSQGGFYLPVRTEDPFGGFINVAYDTYLFAPLQTEDALGNVSQAKIDYRTLQPWQLKDPNDNISEAITDQVGMVIATSIYGAEESVVKGDTPIYASNGDPIYQIQTDASLVNVLADPGKYLQGATTFFYYDLAAWQDRQEPPQSILVARETHVSELVAPEVTKYQRTIAYSDGFGRALQTKILVEPGLAWVKQADNSFAEATVTERWLASGRTVYNNKEKPVKQYEPFYTASYHYEAEAFFATYGVTPVLHYDPLLRVIRTDTPKGFFSKVAFTPWQISKYDENDTVTESAYFQKYAQLPPDEQAALTKAQAHANTPHVSFLDTLGREYEVREYLLPVDQITPANRSANELVTRTTFNIAGKPLTITDPRQVANQTGQLTFQYTYDMNQQILRTVNMDAGDDKVFTNVLGKPIHATDKKGHTIRTTYDLLQRPVATHVLGTGLDNTVERLIYGEGVTDAKLKNLRTRLYQHYDQSGRNEVPVYTFKGEPQTLHRKIRTEYKDEANWPENGNWEALLGTETFTTLSQYDALGRIVNQQQPDGSSTMPVFHPSGKLDQVKVKLKGETAYTPFVASISYNPKGQREVITYGNSTKTTYTYERETFRLTSLKTLRPSDNQELQDIAYTYDPVGNITKIMDHSHERVFYNNQVVDPEHTYTYDALYRLLEATGREHIGLDTPEYYKRIGNFKQSAFINLTDPNDSNKLANYTDRYAYDQAGNLYQMRHIASDSARSYTRDIAVDALTNRAILKENDAPVNFSDYFDANGNCTHLENIAQLNWNYRDNISSAVIIERPSDPDDVEYYVYDSQGQRVRKVKETYLGAGVTEVEEKLYLGGVEIKRISRNTTQILDRSSLHVMDDKKRMAIVHNWAQDDLFREVESAADLSTNKTRYQFENHLGSASLELDAQGFVISYEEYFAYGGTSFIAGTNQQEVKLKEYRYCGKERDDSTGLYYFDARYLDVQNGRFISVDPKMEGASQGQSTYKYSRNNPIIFVDPSGEYSYTVQPGDTFHGIAEKSGKDLGDLEKANPQYGNRESSNGDLKGFDYIKPGDQIEIPHTVEVLIDTDMKIIGISLMHAGIIVEEGKESWNYYAKEGSAKDPDNLIKQKAIERLTEQGITGLTWNNGNVKITGTTKEEIYSKLKATENEFMSLKNIKKYDDTGGNRYEKSYSFSVGSDKAKNITEYLDENYSSTYAPVFGSNHCGDLVVHALVEAGKFSGFKDIDGLKTPYNLNAMLATMVTLSKYSDPNKNAIFNVLFSGPVPKNIIEKEINSAY